MGPTSVNAALRLVELRRDATAVDRDAYLPALAMSVNNLAVRLGEAGRRAEGSPQRVGVTGPDVHNTSADRAPTARVELSYPLPAAHATAGRPAGRPPAWVPPHRRLRIAVPVGLSPRHGHLTRSFVILSARLDGLSCGFV